LLAEPHKIQGGTGIAILVLYLYLQWQGVFGALAPAASAAGAPVAALMLRLFASPLAAIPLAFWIGFAFWGASVYRHPADRRYLATLTWVMLAAFAVPLSTVALFGHFVASSKIPEAVEYYERQQSERRLSQDEQRKLYAALRKISGSLPPFTVSAARDPEATQYAYDFMHVFFAAGLRLRNGERQDAAPDIFDPRSPSLRGV
jgi:hypothetical protein